MRECPKCGCKSVQYEGTYEYEYEDRYAFYDVDEFRCDDCNNVWLVEDK